MYLLMDLMRFVCADMSHMMGMLNNFRLHFLGFNEAVVCIEWGLKVNLPKVVNKKRI